jgi:flagellin
MQYTSLSQGTKNASDAKNLLNVVDGALTNYKDTIGLMKVKATTAASDLSSSESRNALQKDIVNYMKSLNKIANDTSFNGIKLLNGSYSNKQFQIGAYSNQTVDVSISSLNTSKIGHLNETKSAAVSTGTTAATLSINGEVIGQSTVSGTTKDGANLVAEAINAKESETGVRAYGKNSDNGGAVVGGTIADGDIKINGTSIGAVNVNANDSTSVLVDAINAVSGDTKVTARLDAGKLVLDSESGENIHITESNTGAAKAGLTAGTNFGTITLKSQSGIAIDDGDSVSGLNVVTSKNYTMADLDLRTKDGAQRALDILDYALSETNNEASSVGSATNQLDRVIAVNDISVTNLKAAENTIRGANTEEISKELSELQVKYQASMFALQQSNTMQQNVLSLLR